jgi:hypothetical protein
VEPALRLAASCQYQCYYYATAACQFFAEGRRAGNVSSGHWLEPAFIIATVYAISSNTLATGQIIEGQPPVSQPAVGRLAIITASPNKPPDGHAAGHWPKAVMYAIGVIFITVRRQPPLSVDYQSASRLSRRLFSFRHYWLRYYVPLVTCFHCFINIIISLVFTPLLSLLLLIFFWLSLRLSYRIIRLPFLAAATLPDTYLIIIIFIAIIIDTPH